MMASKPVPISHRRLAASPSSQTKATVACATCTRRKVKCDRLQPCSTCRTGRFNCEYLEPPSKKRKRKDFEELEARLSQYEQLLSRHGLSLELPQDSSTGELRRPVAADIGPQLLATPRSISTPVSLSTPTPKEPPADNASTNPNGLLMAGPGPGETRFVESYLWRDLGDNLHPTSDDEDEVPATSTPAPASTAHSCSADLASAGLFGTSPTAHDLSHLYPIPVVAMKLWQVYLRNIDPLLKFVHGPSMTTMFENLSNDPAVMSRETECLLFAIYHFAIVSMTDEERQKIFGELWPEKQKIYHDTTRQCLIDIAFYRTTSLMVLQAYTLLLISVRFQYNPHTFWVLSGTAVRVAQRMGLHSSDEQQLNPFDVQMRRRLWWYILITDMFAAQQAGTTVATIPAESWNAPRPLNIDDTDIWPGMTEPPKEKQGATDMIVYLVRVEITAFRAKLALPGVQKSPQEIEVFMKELEDIVEGKYLRYCDVTDPTHYLILVGTRGALLNARLRARLTRLKSGTASQAESKELFKMALKLLDHDNALTSNPTTRGFAWQMHAFFSWEPLICALKELCREQDAAQIRTAWEKIEGVFKGHPNLVAPKRSIELAVGRLALRAWDLTGRKAGTEPAFLAEVRAALSRRGEARKLKTGEELRTNEAVESTVEPSTMQDALSASQQSPSSWDDTNVDIDWSFWDDLIRSSELEGAEL